MKTSRKYLIATALSIFVFIALLTVASRIYMTDSIPYVPVRTPAAELARLANFTRITVQGDFSLEVTQVQDYSIDFMPLSENQGDLEARVEDATLIITGFGNGTDNDTALLRIGVPVLDTLEVNSVPDIIVSNFTAPLMNIRLVGFRSFTMHNNVIGNLDLLYQGAGEVHLGGNTFTTQRVRSEGQSDLNISPQ